MWRVTATSRLCDPEILRYARLLTAFTVFGVANGEPFFHYGKVFLRRRLIPRCSFYRLRTLSATFFKAISSSRGSLGICIPGQRGSATCSSTKPACIKNAGGARRPSAGCFSLLTLRTKVIDASCDRAVGIHGNV